MNRQLNDERTKVQIEAEKEKMRGNLLQAISHDLQRTPLTLTIIGSTTLIMEDCAAWRSRGAQAAYRYPGRLEWLIGMVENLHVHHEIPARRDNAEKLQNEVVEDVISDAVVEDRRSVSPTSEDHVELPQDILMAPMDSTLNQTVIINLLENAIQHSGDTDILDQLLYKNWLRSDRGQRPRPRPERHRKRRRGAFQRFFQGTGHRTSRLRKHCKGTQGIF